MKQFWIAVDEVFNTVLGGYADETLSARAHRVTITGGPVWPKKVINALFFWQPDHCLDAYRSEFDRKHLPSHYRR